MFRKLLVIAAAMTAAACATPYIGTPYDRAGADVQQIAVADDSMPERLTAYEAASVGSNFGLIGALVDVGIQSNREAVMTRVLGDIGFDAEASLEQRIVAAVSAQGYEVALVEGPDRAKREFLVAYPEAAPGTDAYLDVVVTNYGYLASGAFQPWRPTAEATVRLVSARERGKVLMENVIVYNSMYPQDGVITLSPNPDFSFANQGEMEADPAKLAAGIEDALNQIAVTAAKLLQ
ncbi:hypothetical protein GVN24_28550 [Rhizobium sp. CRIBSB]|nr:hypothetical protein [Rhizobium sp. CRIBSB]